MELENLFRNSKVGIFDDQRSRPKTSHRLHYEAQVQVIKKQSGDLENIREKLGLSGRKISQLLMVDPSAWTRWTKHKDQVPPHIYRALQWYLILQEKIPGLTPQYFIGKDPEVLHQSTLKRLLELQSQNDLLQGQIFRLEVDIKNNRVGFMMMALAGIILAFAVYWRFLRV